MKYLSNSSVLGRLGLALGAVAVSVFALASERQATQGANEVLPVTQRGLSGAGGGGIQTSTIDDDTPVPPVGSLGGPSSALTGPDLEQWLRGRLLFDKDFHKSDGLGAPGMNADSCRACHQDPVIGGAGNLELNVSRIGDDQGGGGPFTDLPDGQMLSKLFPSFIEGREEYDFGQFDNYVFEQRQTPPLFGLGFIDEITEATIVANADPSDLDGDGIVGVPRMIDVNGVPEIGRFGWKGQIPNVLDFVRDAMGGECGITTEDDGRGFGMRTDLDAVADPELPIVDIDDIAFFLNNLAAPPRGGNTDPAVAVGETLFSQIGCAKCHVPTLQGPAGPVDLYSDLLLHDIWPANFRGMAEPGAGVGLYQTPPLWGAVHSFPYMHDGRAETLEEAILLHDGTALTVRQSFEALPQADKDALILFLEDL
ncbi:MAG: di-heme oxidoredictase family protein [Planctomycetota bacterium]